MFSALSLNKELNSYGFYFTMINYVKRPCQGGHNAETKNIACERQPIAFYVYVLKL